jgi:hypothetical protein
MMEDFNTENLVVELAEIMRSHFFGKYRGLVKRVDDPDKQGRITATVPEVFGDLESPWAFPSAPLAGKNYGFFMLPKEGDGVWIEFEAGDPARPIWSGFWWAKDEVSSDAGEDVRIIVTPAGHKIILDDNGNEIKLVHSGGAQIVMGADNITMQKGSSKLVVSDRSVNINDGALEVSS